MTLDEMLFEYGKSDYYPFHMPGHKRQVRKDSFSNPYGLDITEIDGFDNLHHSQGILREAQDRAARLYGADKTYFLVNGSTSGLLAAVSAAVSPKGTLLMARNCHKAAFHGAYLRELQVRYICPPMEETLGINGSIQVRQVEKALEECPQAEAVLLTSPTYDGVVSDIRSIAKAVHKRGIPLLVDEAHGAHFPFSDYFPSSALENGADVVIQSLHKTLPSLTQTAVLHEKGGRVSKERLERFLGIYQSSSPSYVLMAGIDSCLKWAEEDGKTGFGEYTERLSEFREKMKELQVFSLLEEEKGEENGVFAWDKSKLVFSTKAASIDGKRLYDLLRKDYHLQLEMAAGQYALALSSVMDTKEGFDRLAKAMLELDLEEQEAGNEVPLAEKMVWNKVLEDKADDTGQAYSIAQGIDCPFEEIFLEDCEGYFSGEFVYLYPPGTPIIVPGEKIPQGFAEKVRNWKNQGLDIQGPVDYTLKKIRIMRINDIKG